MLKTTYVLLKNGLNELVKSLPMLLLLVNICWLLLLYSGWVLFCGSGSIIVLLLLLLLLFAVGVVVCCVADIRKLPMYDVGPGDDELPLVLFVLLVLLLLLLFVLLLKHVPVVRVVRLLLIGTFIFGGV